MNVRKVLLLDLSAFLGSSVGVAIAFAVGALFCIDIIDFDYCFRQIYTVELLLYILCSLLIGMLCGMFFYLKHGTNKRASIGGILGALIGGVSFSLMYLGWFYLKAGLGNSSAIVLIFFITLCGLLIALMVLFFITWRLYINVSR